MKKYVIISKSRLDYFLSNIEKAVEKSSASKIDVGKVKSSINQINHASFVRESEDEEFINALDMYNSGKSDA